MSTFNYKGKTISIPNGYSQLDVLKSLRKGDHVYYTSFHSKEYTNILKTRGWPNRKLITKKAKNNVYTIEINVELLIQNVVKGTDAYKGGLRGGFIKIKVLDSELYIGGDVILAINGISLDSEKSINDLKDLQNKFSLIKQDKIEVDVLREGKVIKLFLNVTRN